MKEGNLKIVGAVVVIFLIIFSIFAVTTRKEIEEINEDIEEVMNQPISVRILSDTSSGTNPLNVNFKPLVLNNKDQVEYHWEFGDGNTSNEKEPSHIFKESGVYSCKLTVKDGDTTITDSFNVTVFPNNPPKIKILTSSTTGFRPVTISFDAEVFDPEGEEVEYLWTLKYPPLYGYERIETYETKNFSKTFIRNGNYVAELTITDEAGNKVTDYEIIQVGKSQIEQMIQGLKFIFIMSLPPTLSIVWGAVGYPPKLIDYLEEHWLDWGPNMQKIALLILSKFLAIDYTPPIPKAELEVSEIEDIDLSGYVNATTGVVEEDVSISSSFTITNIDVSNVSKNIYISLYNPFSKIEGLNDDIEKEELIVGIKDDIQSNQLFYNGQYTNWEDCYNIEKLASGDEIKLDITVTLEEGGVFNKDTYPSKFYIYQEASLDKAEYIDEIPFTIIL